MSENNILSLDTKSFATLSVEQLRALQKTLRDERNRRRKQFITPVEKQHLNPLKDQYIKPLKDEHLAPINQILKELNKHIPKKNEEQVYFIIDGRKYGPCKRKVFLDKIVTANINSSNININSSNVKK